MTTSMLLLSALTIAEAVREDGNEIIPEEIQEETSEEILEDAE